MKDFRLASRAPLTEAERGWIDLFRSIFPDGVPGPNLRLTQAVRMALAGNRSDWTAQAAQVGMDPEDVGETAIAAACAILAATRRGNRFLILLIRDLQRSP